jgi:phosphoribosylglycinamide formyltransferase-1
VIHIAVFVSGSGTNLQTLIDNCESGYIPARIVLVVSSKPSVPAITRAQAAGIDAVTVDRKEYGSDENFTNALLEVLSGKKIDLICLAGFLSKIGTSMIKNYSGRIINIHPALLPNFGGKGMYGIRVHEAVIASGKTESGCTVHLVDEEYDHGAVILQKKVPVLPDDTPDILARRVLKEEHIAYPEAVRKFVLNYKKIN